MPNKSEAKNILGYCQQTWLQFGKGTLLARFRRSKKYGLFGNLVLLEKTKVREYDDVSPFL